MAPSRLALLPRDARYVAVLLALASVPLLLLRLSWWPGSTALAAACWVAALAVTVAWCRWADRPPGLTAAPAPWGVSWRSVLVAVAFAALTVLCYYLPMRKHFWGGVDDFYSLTGVESFWNVDFDDAAGRPMMCFGTQWLVRTLTPERIEGILWVTVGLCFLCGLLLYGCVRLLLPDWPGVAVVAGALLITNPTDPSRFFPFWISISYLTSLTIFLLSVWLFLLSYHLGRRSLLAAACVVLGVALLGLEGLFPLAALAWLLVWVMPRSGASRWTWFGAWGGTVALNTVRFVVFLVTCGSGSYQSRQMAKTLADHSALQSNVATQLWPLADFFTPASRSGMPLAGLLIVAAVAVGAVLLRGSAPVTWRSRGGLALGVVVGAVAICFGLLPFIHFPNVFRTQFLAWPGQAALVACAVALVCGLLPRRLGLGLLAVACGLMVANAHQRSRLLQAQPADIRFEHVTHMMQQLHTISPSLREDVPVLLVLEKGAPSPVARYNYGMDKMTLQLFHVRCCQVNLPDPFGHVADFRKDTVLVTLNVADFHKAVTVNGVAVEQMDVGYDQLLAFHVESDGTLRLMQRLPEELLPTGHSADRYNPLPLLGAGVPGPLPYFRYESCNWVPQDVVPPGAGLMLGEGWGPRESRDGELWREASPSATVVVNPMGRDRCELVLDLEPVPSLAGQTVPLKVVNEKGETVARAELRGRTKLEVSAPLDPARVGMLRLCVDAPWGECYSDNFPVFRMYRPGGGKAPARPAKQEDVCRCSGLRLGGGWHELEFYEGLWFRWVDQGAEFVVAPIGAQTNLTLDVEAGPSQGGECEMLVLSESGEVVARAMVGGRRPVALTLPTPESRQTRFRLSPAKPGKPLGTDPRILNFRVFELTRAVTVAPAAP